MLIKIKNNNEICPSEITDQETFKQRREFIKQSGQFALAAAGSLAAPDLLAGALPAPAPRAKIEGIKKGPFSTEQKPTKYKDITSYCNYYEFGTGKRDPSVNAHTLKTSPWQVAIEGEVEKPGTYNLEDILKPHDLEERIYRFRCVEAWSMVVPWVGFPLADLIKRFKPTSKAKYVEFQTLYDPENMPGQRRRILSWPYTEGLRMDEAMNPLTMMVVGLYGEVLPNQNGAPLRLIVPWKYGFKSIKSIAKIRFTEHQPSTAWNQSAPREYGFYSNVNPTVSHPRWSQAKERVLGSGFFAKKAETKIYNGYADEVASLYTGMDLRKFF